MNQAVFLRHLDVAGECGAGHAFFVRRDQPDRHEPFAQRDFAVLEDRSDLYREALFAVAALVIALVGEVVNLGRSAMRAMGALVVLAPTDAAQMINGRLFIGEGFHHLEQAVELHRHGRRSIATAAT